MEEEQRTVTVRDRFTHQHLSALVPILRPIIWGILLVLGVGGVVFFIVDRQGFLWFMPQIFKWTVDCGTIIGIVYAAFRFGLGSFITHVIGGWVHHVIVPLRQSKVYAVNNNFMATHPKVNVVQHGLSRTRVQEVEADPVLALEPPPVIKTFAQLLNEGLVSTALQQGKLILGYVGSELRYGSWLDLYSCAIAGVTGSGKTTTVLFLLFQAVLAGAQLVVIDPHLSDPEESLATRLMTFASAMAMPPCDDTPLEALRRIHWFKLELARRKRNGIKGPALILVIDEFNGIMRRPQIAEVLADLLLEIEQEGRKFGIFAMLIGQIWTRDTIGKAEIRQCLASAMVHRMGEAEQAKKLLSLPKYANKTVELETGHHLFKDTHGRFTEMVTPLTVDADAHTVAQLLPRSELVMEDLPLNQNTASEMTSAWRPQAASGRHAESDVQPPGQPLDATPADVSLAPEMEAKMILVLEMDEQEKNQNEIIEAVWGCGPDTRQGRAAKEELRAIRRHIAARHRILRREA